MSHILIFKALFVLLDSEFIFDQQMTIQDRQTEQLEASWCRFIAFVSCLKCRKPINTRTLRVKTPVQWQGQNNSKLLELPLSIQFTSSPHQVSD